MAVVPQSPNRIGGNIFINLTNREDSITATAGGGQTTAYQLAAQMNRVTTVATANDSVQLPKVGAQSNVPGAVGWQCVVHNLGAAAMQLYGHTADTLNGIATGTGISVPAGEIALCWPSKYTSSTDVGDWTVIVVGAGSEAFSAITVTNTATIGDIAGGDASLDIVGLAAAQGGSVNIVGGASSTGSNAGGAGTIAGAAGTAGTGTTAGGVGGAASVTGGAGGSKATTGAAAGGAGGTASVAAGAGGNTASSGSNAGGAGANGSLSGGVGGNATAGTGNGGRGGDANLSAGTGGTSAGGTAGRDGVIRQGSVVARKVTRSTISSGGTITPAQVRTAVLYQDASGGNVTMTSPTASDLDIEFPTLATGEALDLFCASNHASNTSTISGGSSVSLVGSGAMTQLGGSFKLIRTGTGTYDLVRVG